MARTRSSGIRAQGPGYGKVRGGAHAALRYGRSSRARCRCDGGIAVEHTPLLGKTRPVRCLIEGGAGIVVEWVRQRFRTIYKGFGRVLRSIGRTQGDGGVGGGDGRVSAGVIRAGTIEWFEGEVIGKDVRIGEAAGGLAMRQTLVLQISGGGLRPGGMTK